MRHPKRLIAAKLACYKILTDQVSVLVESRRANSRGNPPTDYILVRVIDIDTACVRAAAEPEGRAARGPTVNTDRAEAGECAVTRPAGEPEAEPVRRRIPRQGRILRAAVILEPRHTANRVAAVIHESREDAEAASRPDDEETAAGAGVGDRRQDLDEHPGTIAKCRLSRSDVPRRGIGDNSGGDVRRSVVGNKEPAPPARGVGTVLNGREKPASDGERSGNGIAAAIDEHSPDGGVVDSAEDHEVDVVFLIVSEVGASMRAAHRRSDDRCTGTCDVS